MKKLIKKYAGSYSDRVITLTTGSAAVNFVTAAAKFIIGVDLHSFWYIVNAVYYITLVAARILSVYTYRKVKKAPGADEKLKIEELFYKRSGIFIFLIAAIYFLLCVYMYEQQYAVVAEGYDVIVVVFIVIYKLTFSIYGLYVTRKMRDKITETVKTISFTDAGISLTIAICTVINFIDENVAVKTGAALGMTVSAMFIAAGIFMTVPNKNRKPKSL